MIAETRYHFFINKITLKTMTTKSNKTLSQRECLELAYQALETAQEQATTFNQVEVYCQAKTYVKSLLDELKKPYENNYPY